MWWHASGSDVEGLNVLKCKWLDAWKPKWEARFYMGQRQEDYRSEINGGEGGGEADVNRGHTMPLALWWLLHQGATQRGLFFSVNRRVFGLLWKKNEPSIFETELITHVMEPESRFQLNVIIRWKREAVHRKMQTCIWISLVLYLIHAWSLYLRHLTISMPAGLVMSPYAAHWWCLTCWRSSMQKKKSLIFT